MGVQGAKAGQMGPSRKLRRHRMKWSGHRADCPELGCGVACAKQYRDGQAQNQVLAQAQAQALAQNQAEAQAQAQALACLMSFHTEII